jgi:glycosyltransferase involved in cell wall biosynthesis
MRVLLDTSYAARGRSGTAVYLERLAEALRATGEVELVEAGAGRRRRRGGPNPLRSASNALGDAAWLHAGLPRAARAARADVVHHAQPVLSRTLAVPQVVTVHDVAFASRPEGYGRAWRGLAARQYRRAVTEADAVICVSESTAAEAVALLGARRERLVVAHHGPGQRLPAVDRSGPPEHFLYVGDAEERKDVPGLLDAYRAYRAGTEDPLDLVLAGAAARLAASPGVRGEEDPGPRSLTELEAMAAAVPVVAVSSTGVREIAGDAALLVEPGELADGLRRIDRDPGLRLALADAGPGRAADFSWARSARRHLDAYTLARQTQGRAR